MERRWAHQGFERGGHRLSGYGRDFKENDNRLGFRHHDGWFYGKQLSCKWPTNRYRRNGGQTGFSANQARKKFSQPQRRQHERNDWQWGARRKDPLYRCFDKFDYSKIAQKFFRPKQNAGETKGVESVVKEVAHIPEENVTYEVMSIIRINSEVLNDSVNDLREKAFFLNGWALGLRLKRLEWDANLSGGWNAV